MGTEFYHESGQTGQGFSRQSAPSGAAVAHVYTQTDRETDKREDRHVAANRHF
jgi:hypothetical protein